MKNNIVKDKVQKEYKNNAPYYMAYSALFSTIIVLIFALAYFLPISLVITIPFIFVPFAVSFQSCIYNILLGNGYSSGAFFKFYALYFSRMFFGVTKSLLGILKSLGVYFGLYFVIAMPSTAIVILSNPEYAALLNDLTPENISILNNLAVTDPTLSLLIPIASGFAFMSAGYMFLHHFFFHSVRVTAKYMYIAEVPFVSNMIYDYGFKRIKGLFAKDYYSSLWQVIIIYVSASIIGFVFCYFLINSSYSYPGIFGVALGIFVVSFFLPYIYLVLYYSIESHFEEFHEGAKEDLLKDLEESIALGRADETTKAFLKKSFEVFDKSRRDKNPDFDPNVVDLDSFNDDDDDSDSEK